MLFYGESTGHLGNAMLARGPQKISAGVLYESEVIRINKAKAWPQRLLAVYPSEGKVPIFYTVAYGATVDDKDDPDPPDRVLLEKIAAQTGGRAYLARPENIDKALEDISAFFGARPRSTTAK